MDNWEAQSEAPSPELGLIRLSRSTGLDYAEHIGNLRDKRARKLNLQNTYGFNRNRDYGQTLNIEGAITEYAAAQALGYPWPPNPHGLHDPHGDVAHIEVRSTGHGTGPLIMHNRDHAHRPYLLVILHRHNPRHAIIQLVGYYQKEWGLHPEWWNEPRPGGGAYFIPQTHLHPWTDLKATP